MYSLRVQFKRVGGGVSEALCLIATDFRGFVGNCAVNICPSSATAGAKIFLHARIPRRTIPDELKDIIPALFLELQVRV